MNKRFWIPVLMGAITAAIGFLITYADLTLYLGVNAITGVPLGYDGREIFIIICSALGGPLAAVIAILQFPFIGLYMSIPATGVAMVMLDRLAASMAVVFLYRYMYLHIKRIPFMMLFWAAAIWAYYSISYNIALISGSILSGTSIIENYQHYGVLAVISLFFSLEPPFTYVFTILILLAIPPHYRIPLWMQMKETITRQRSLLKEDTI
jgi:hypothetical protein